MSGRGSILWLSHFVIYPPHGGARIRSFHLLREISRGFDVDLFMLDPREEGFAGKDVGSEERELLRYARSVSFLPLPSASVLGKGALAARSLFSRQPVTTSRLYDRGHARRLREQAASRAYDFVHLDTVDLAAYLPCFDGPADRITLNHHNVESRLLSRQAARMRNPLLGRYLALQAERLAALERRLCPRVAANIVVSELDGDVLSKSCGGDFTVLRNGVDLDFHAPDPARADRPATTLVWAGGMHWFPNRDAAEYFLSEIWPYVHDRRPELDLLLVGNSPPAVGSAPGSERIEAPGYVPDVRPYLARGDIYVAPIRVGSGTRLKILDAFASGIPVVSTAVGCEGLEVRDGEHLLVRDDPRAFGDAVLELAEDREQRNRLARSALELVRKTYSWERIGEDARALYDRLRTRAPT